MGSSLAIEDAEALGALLGRHLRRGGGPADLRPAVLVPFARTQVPVAEDLMRRARAAVTNRRHESADQGYVVSPFVPTRLGSAVVRGYEQLRGRRILA